MFGQCIVLCLGYSLKLSILIQQNYPYLFNRTIHTYSTELSILIQQIFGIPVKDPAGFERALDTVDPLPVLAEPKAKSAKRKRNSSQSGKSAKSRKSKSKSKSKGPKLPGTPEADHASAVDAVDIINSFPEMYRDTIKALPTMLWPTSSKHGEHSYTAILV